MAIESTFQKNAGTNSGIEDIVHSEMPYQIPPHGIRIEDDEQKDKMPGLSYSVDLGGIKGEGYVFSSGDRVLCNMLFSYSGGQEGFNTPNNERDVAGKNLAINFVYTRLLLDELIMGSGLDGSSNEIQELSKERRGGYNPQANLIEVSNYKNGKSNVGKSKDKITPQKTGNRKGVSADYRVSGVSAQDVSNVSNVSSVSNVSNVSNFSNAKNVSDYSRNEANVNLSYNGIINHIQNIFNQNVSKSSGNENYAVGKARETGRKNAYKVQEGVKGNGPVYERIKHAKASGPVDTYAKGIEDIVNDKGSQKYATGTRANAQKYVNTTSTKNLPGPASVSASASRAYSGNIASNQQLQGLKNNNRLYKAGSQKNSQRYKGNNPAGAKTKNGQGRINNEKQGNIESLIESSPLSSYNRGNKGQGDGSYKTQANSYAGKNVNFDGYSKRAGKGLKARHGYKHGQNQYQDKGYDKRSDTVSRGNYGKKDVWEYDPKKDNKNKANTKGSYRVVDKNPANAAKKRVGYSGLKNRPSLSLPKGQGQKLLGYEKPLTVDEYLYGGKNNQHNQRKTGNYGLMDDIAAKGNYGLKGMNNYAKQPVNYSMNSRGGGYSRARPNPVGNSYGGSNGSYGLPMNGLSRLSSPPKTNVINMSKR